MDLVILSYRLYGLSQALCYVEDVHSEPKIRLPAHATLSQGSLGSALPIFTPSRVRVCRSSQASPYAQYEACGHYWGSYDSNLLWGCMTAHASDLNSLVLCSKYLTFFPPFMSMFLRDAKRQRNEFLSCTEEFIIPSLLLALGNGV